ncbi:MAG: hypothetical protein MZV65_14305 [Chromatiales bacterium]|nr:hypothetical protein [Chromatiales bacterium]
MEFPETEIHARLQLRILPAQDRTRDAPSCASRVDELGRLQPAFFSVHLRRRRLHPRPHLRHGQGDPARQRHRRRAAPDLHRLDTREKIRETARQLHRAAASTASSRCAATCRPA